VPVAVAMTPIILGRCLLALSIGSMGAYRYAQPA